MTGKELKKLSRTELLEMLLRQVEETEQLRLELAQAREDVENRAILMEDAGSIAEASLRISGVFEQAQKAADLYLENIRRVNSQPDAVAQEILNRAQAQADTLLADARRRSDRIRAEADEYWALMCRRVQDLLQEN